MHNDHIDQRSFGLGSLVELMAKLPDVVEITRPNPTGDFLLKRRQNPGYNLVSFVLITT